MTLFATILEWNSPLIGLGSISLGLIVAVILSLDKVRMNAVMRPGAAISALLLAIGLLSPNSSSMALSVENWVYVHLILILFGYAGFTIGAIIGGIYVIVQSRLKKRDLQGIADFPTLHSLDRYNFWCMIIGFSGLLSGVLSGVFWALSNGKVLSLDLTVIISYLLLFWYSVALCSRYFGRRGRFAAWFSILGFSSLTIFFFLSSIVGNWHMG
jgi:ABC-type uncharacterized transport system permease subunit